MCDLFGIKSDDLVRVSLELEQTLNISFVLHDSIHRGGDYYYYRLRDPMEVEIILQRNEEMPGEVAEPGCTDCPIILYVCMINHEELIRIRHQVLNAMKNNIILVREDKSSS